MHHWTPLPQGLYLKTFNIRDGWGFEIVQSNQAVHIGGVDLLILTETNINVQDYFQNRLGYNVLCTLVITTAAGGAH